MAYAAGHLQCASEYLLFDNTVIVFTTYESGVNLRGYQRTVSFFYLAHAQHIMTKRIE